MYLPPEICVQSMNDLLTPVQCHFWSNSMGQFEQVPEKGGREFLRVDGRRVIY